MTTDRHGVSLGMERTDGDFFLTIKPVGKLTHDDYEKLVPMFESMLKCVEEPRVRALIDITDFGGWEARALWDELKLDIRYNKAFDKVAVYGHGGKLEKGLTQVSGWFMDGEVRFFDNVSAAMQWLGD